MTDSRMLKKEEIFCPNNTENNMDIDNACIIFENTLNVLLTLYKKFDVCHRCSYEFWMDIPANKTVSLLVPIYTDVSFQYHSLNYATSSCIVNYQFELNGVYKYFLDFSCDTIKIVEPPDNPYTSFFICIVIILIIWVFDMFWLNKSVRQARKHGCTRIHTLLNRLNRLPKSTPSDIEIEGLKAEPAAETIVQGEIVVEDEKLPSDEQIMGLTSKEVKTTSSLEGVGSQSVADNKHMEFVEFEALLAFRGLFAIVWVYFCGGTSYYTFMRSSPWDGLGIHDIPIGWLYWALGASFYLHLDYGFFRGKTRWRLFLRGVLLRSVLYIAGGFFYNNINSTSPLHKDYVPLNKIRVFGIFQRVGMANLITSSAEVIFMKSHIKRGPYFQDLRDTWPQWVVVTVLILTHTGITLWLPVPGCPTGYTGPGGVSNKSENVQCTGGAAGHIDRVIFNPTHLLPPAELEDTSPPVYKISVAFDPQGLLGTLTTCLLMTLAMQASRIFIYFQQPFGRIIRLLFWAMLQLLLGGILCGFRTQEGPIPPNRLLMSLSYVLLVSGMAYIAVLILFLFINVFKLWTAVFLIYYGINMLVPLVGCQLFKHMIPFHFKYIDDHQKELSLVYLLYTMWHVVLWCIVCYSLLKLRIVVHV